VPLTGAVTVAEEETFRVPLPQSPPENKPPLTSKIICPDVLLNVAVSDAPGVYVPPHAIVDPEASRHTCSEMRTHHLLVGRLRARGQESASSTLAGPTALRPLDVAELPMMVEPTESDRPHPSIEGYGLARPTSRTAKAVRNMNPGRGAHAAPTHAPCGNVMPEMAACSVFKKYVIWGPVEAQTKLPKKASVQVTCMHDGGIGLCPPISTSPWVRNGRTRRPKPRLERRLAARAGESGATPRAPRATRCRALRLYGPRPHNHSVRQSGRHQLVM
jgi:hypothetical protein